MKPIHVGFVLMALICAVGIASAVTPAPTLIASGIVEQDTISLTLPSNPSLTLTRGSDNIQGCGYATITQTGSANQWMLEVSGGDGYMYLPDATTKLGTPMSISLVESDPITWTSLTSSPPPNVVSGTSPINVMQVPIYIKQPVSLSDAGGNYQITLTFTLSTT